MHKRADGVTDDKLFRTAIDLPAALAATARPLTFSTVYSERDEGGTTINGLDAWAYI